MKRRFVLAALTFLFTALGSSERATALTKLSDLAADVRAGRIVRMQIVARPYMMMFRTALQPMDFEEHASWQLSCELPVQAVRLGLANVLDQDTTRDGTFDLFWRVRFLRDNGQMAGTIYLDRSYSNSDVTGILVGIGAKPAQVNATVARWFETHVDAERCRFI